MELEKSSQNSSELELLSFRLADEEYSVDIMSVREIRGWTRATPLPHAPYHVRGVINLRGTVLPVVDLSVRLGMEPVEGDARNVIIVVQVGSQTAGLLVNAVSDILALPRTELQPPPELAADAAHSFIEALTIVDGRMIRVLDLSAVLPDDNVEAA
ncbi:purine-binding chemotaxis protein CheW [Rhodobacter aestuarii]|uniref:Purine-binding chemotaxis protein CheW n=1 Tax=Rhodobacter aestuarii TaxID=453582 RepID=A0A1N7J9L8_9RHOB|nr:MULTISPECIES: chemotaxis protein CheW [Rhodobacter]PTV97026.1 purine-binding chemotaxis protein CheW [Rhodobacter aestuarii]SIS46028.1 purine-binding chemotaxis protein CheW [Rhodobacter aestuarii]SOB98318.1 purine-binding chemotaxis protein CheW [Rhodobacter sp. JA431]